MAETQPPFVPATVQDASPKSGQIKQFL